MMLAGGDATYHRMYVALTSASVTQLRTEEAEW